MKSFAERSPFIIGAVGVSLVGGIVALALNYDKLPLVNSEKHYSAYFAEAGGRPACGSSGTSRRVPDRTSVVCEAGRCAGCGRVRRRQECAPRRAQRSEYPDQDPAGREGLAGDAPR